MVKHFQEKKNIIQLNMLNILMYLASPFLAIPSILISLTKRNRFNPFFYGLLIAFFSFLFKPGIEMDKARHFDFYEYISTFTFSQFLAYNFEQSPDFIFQLIEYLGARNNISFHHIVFITTFITVFLIFKVFYSFYNSLIISNTNKYIIALLFIFALPYIDIFSGLRYTLAAAFCFYGLNMGLIHNKKLGIIFLLLGVFTHFSTFLFLVLYFIFPFLQKIKIQRLRFILIISLLFILVPSSILLDIFKSMGFGSALDVKANAYLGEQNTDQVQDSFSALFIKFFNVLWIIILSFYFIFKKQQQKSVYYTILICLLIFTNIFISLPIIFNRYALFIKLFLVLYLIESELKNHKLKLTLVFLGIFMIICINQIIVMRVGLFPMFIPSITNWSFVYQIFENNFTTNDIH